MDNPTDAAVEAEARKIASAAYELATFDGLHIDRQQALRNYARHVLTRQPGPEDVERIAQAPTRSALDSALDPMLGNSPVRKAVVDVVLGLFENARRPLTEVDIVRIAERATDTRAKRGVGYSFWMDLPDYIHVERTQFTRDILAAASWPMAAPTDSAASDRLAWLEKTRSETMDQNDQLIVERDVLNARIAIPVSDCATHNGPAVESNLTQKAIAALRADASNYRTTASRETVSIFTKIFTEMAKERTLWADAIEAQAVALRTVRILIASLRANDFNCYTIAGIADTMDDAERAAIAEYDAVLAQIDEVLK